MVGAFPCLLGRWDHGYRARLALGATIGLPSEYLADIWCDSLTHDPAGLRYLVERVGAGQVLLGSDHPFDMGEPDPVARSRPRSPTRRPGPRSWARPPPDC